MHTYVMPYSARSDMCTAAGKVMVMVLDLSTEQISVKQCGSVHDTMSNPVNTRGPGDSDGWTNHGIHKSTHATTGCDAVRCYTSTDLANKWGQIAAVGTAWDGHLAVVFAT